MTNEDIHIDHENAAQMQALDIVKNTNYSFFLTGRAGTGKTTFLHYIRTHVKKQFVMVAPTGIAAIVAGGVTIHSFFGMPFLRKISNSHQYILIFFIFSCIFQIFFVTL